MIKKSLIPLIAIAALLTACTSSEPAQSTESNGNQITEVSANQDEISNLTNTIDELEIDVQNLEDEVSRLQSTISDLERFADQTTCQSISLSQFKAISSPGTAFVVTPSKMGWTSEWTIRNDQIQERDESVFRSYEFRIDLTPENPDDALQEIHTSLLAFPSPELASASFETREIDNSRIVDTSQDFRIPISAFGPKLIDDSATTMKIQFLCDNFDVTIKVKFLTDPAIGMPILERAAWTVLGEISNIGP